MLRSGFAILLSVFVLAAHAENKSACEARPGPGDTIDFTCPLGVGQNYTFRAHFTGSHDDTVLSLKAALDGETVACAEGSKTESRFEDGDISLECRFSIANAAGVTSVLGVMLKWHHAQYTGFELGVD